MNIKNLILIFIIIFAASCHKGGDPIPASIPLPEFTCGDASDDAKFENWNSAETEYLTSRTGLIYPDHELPGYLTWISTVRNQVSLHDSEVAIQYMLAKPANSIIAITDHEKTKAPLFTGSARQHGDTTVAYLKINGSSLVPGCNRIYYQFYKQDSVVTKGHLDIQVIQ